jgi:hypothetical protein
MGLCKVSQAFGVLPARVRASPSQGTGDGRAILVDLLLLVDGELAGAAVDEQQETTDNGEDLEEVVLGEVLVGVVFVEL